MNLPFDLKKGIDWYVVLGGEGKESLFATDTITESHNQSKGRVVEPSRNEYIYKITSALQVQGTLGQRRQEHCKSQRSGEFNVRVCLLVMSEATPRKSHQHGCLNTS